MAWQTPKTNWAPEDGVRDADFNRIEGNILELYRGSSGMSDTTIYVSSTGSDTTGTGASAAPYKTINYALSTLPKNLNGRNVLVYIANGTYTEDVVVKGFSNGMITLIGYYGAIATMYSITISSAICEVRSLELRLSSAGVTVTNGSVFLCSGAITASDVERCLHVINGSTCKVNAQLTAYNTTVAAVHATGASKVYVLNISGSGNTAVIVAEEGSIAAYGSTNITVTSLTFISRTGGRVLTGSGGIS